MNRIFVAFGWGEPREKGGVIRVHVCVGIVSCLTQSVQAHVSVGVSVSQR